MGLGPMSGLVGVGVVPLDALPGGFARSSQCLLGTAACVSSGSAALVQDSGSAAGVRRVRRMRSTTRVMSVVATDKTTVPATIATTAHSGKWAGAAVDGGRRRDRSARSLRREPARRGGGKADRWGQEDRQPAERCERPAGSGDAASCWARLRWCWSVVHLGDSFGCLGGCFWVACSAHRQCNAGGVESAWGRLGTKAWNGGGPVAGTAVDGRKPLAGQ